MSILLDISLQPKGSYPSVGKEKFGKWVGIAEKQGDALTYLILTADTDYVIAHFFGHSATNTKNPKLRAQQSSTGGELDNKPKPILQSSEDLFGIYLTKLKLPKFSPDELSDITSLRDNGERPDVQSKSGR
jgi:hypothetical protein